RHKPTRPTKPIATRASVDGSGTGTAARVHVPLIPDEKYPQKLSRKPLSGPQFGAASSASNRHVPSACVAKKDGMALRLASCVPSIAGSSKNSSELVNCVKFPPASSAYWPLTRLGGNPSVPGT